MYFTVTADGKPLRQRRYCFSEEFYAIANAEYYGITGDRKMPGTGPPGLSAGIRSEPRRSRPHRLGPKTIPETRKGRALADPMIFLNMTSVLRRVDPEQAALYDQYSAQCVHDIFAYHHKPDLHCTLESVGMNGEFQSDISAGRVVNPGHDIECSWFLMEEANRIGSRDLHRKAEDVFRFAINAGWDQEYGGLLYFIDCMGLPPEAYEHDMKLWWPHNEILIASLMATATPGTKPIWTGSTKPSPIAATTSPTLHTGSGMDTCAGTANPRCLPAREAPSRARSTCPAAFPWRTSSSTRFSLHKKEDWLCPVSCCCHWMSAPATFSIPR